MESLDELLLGVLFWIVPGKFVLVQPATPVNKGNAEHIPATRRGRVCARASFRVANALAGFFFEDFGEYEHHFYVLLNGDRVGVSRWSRNRSRSLRTRRRCGSLQNGYGRDRDSGYTLRSESCRQDIPDTFGSLGETRVRLAFLLLRIAENSDERGRTRLADKRLGRGERVRLAFLPLRIAKNGDLRWRTGLENRRKDAVCARRHGSGRGWSVYG